MPRRTAELIQVEADAESCSESDVDAVPKIAAEADIRVGRIVSLPTAYAGAFAVGAIAHLASVRWPSLTFGGSRSLRLSVKCESAGAVVAVASLGLFVASTRTVAAYAQTLDGARFRRTAIVHTGPYAYSRHPICLSLVGGLLGVGLMLRSPAMAAIAPLFALLLHCTVIRTEECAMHASFREVYDSYASRVRCWF